MTAEELETLKQELHTLEGDGRRDIAAKIKTARAWGDLSENAEYHAAKEAQAHLETRILRLREQVRRAEVVEPSGDRGTVEHGSTVTYVDRTSGQEQTFKIVSPHDADPSNGALSSVSPIAAALLGRSAQDVVAVSTPRGVRELEIRSIR